MSLRLPLAAMLLLLQPACVLPEPDDVPVEEEEEEEEEPTPPEPSDCLLAAEEPAEWTLVDVALEVGVQDRFGVNTGLAAEDFDGDGDIDLYTANGGEPPGLYLAQDDGSFLPHPSPPSTGDDLGPSAVDFDNDGDADLYIACGGWRGACPNRLFRNDGLDGDGVLQFVNVSAAAGIAATSRSTFGGTWADYDRDGDLDLFQPCKDLPGPDGPPSGDQLFRNEGDGTFTEVGDEAGVDGTADGHPSTWLDYDEDGWPDLFVAVLNGSNRLLHNEGDGTFTDVTPEMMESPRLAFASLTADFDNDGHADLMSNGRSLTFGDPIWQDHALFLGDGAGGWTDATQDTGMNDPDSSAHHISTMGFQAADLDLDGFPEVVFGDGDPDGGELNAFGSLVMTTEGLRWVDRFALIDSPVAEDGAGDYPPYPYRTHGIAFFDYEDDGDMDLYLGNGGGSAVEPNRLFRNDTESQNGWVRLELNATTGAPSAIGARVRVADGPPGWSSWEVHRTLGSTSGFNSSMPRRMTIGTGRCEGPYHIQIEWPQGAVEELEEVPSGTHLVVVEGE